MGSDDTIYQKELDFFSKYLSVWVAVCIMAGTAIGHYFPGISESLAKVEHANVSIPIAIVLLMMMYPIMLKVKYTELIKVRKNAKPSSFTLIVNWGVKPFTMAIIA